MHLFVGFNPSVLISEFVKEIKVESNHFLVNKGWVGKGFHWQEGYGVFSYSRSHIDKVCRYIINQEEHHRKKTFKEEYHEFLEKFMITYEERFLFDFMQEPVN
jgi:hypothetical protein